MKTSISLGFCVGGFMLIAYAVSASDTIGADFFHFFAGSPQENTIWLLISGAVAEIIGVSGLMGKTHSY